MIYTALVLETPSITIQEGPLVEMLRRNCATEYNPRSTQLTLLTRRFGLTLTRGGLKEGDALGRSFAAHWLRYSFAVGLRLVDTALMIWGA